MWAFYYQKLLFTEKTNILEKVTQMSQNSFEKYLFFLKNSIEKVAKREYIICKGADCYVEKENRTKAYRLEKHKGT